MQKMIRFILWPMIALSVVAYVWMQMKAGHFTNKGYIFWCGGSMLGQLGTAIEAGVGHAWGTTVVQSFFFIVTAFGGIKRYREMQRKSP